MNRVMRKHYCSLWCAIVYSLLFFSPSHSQYGIDPCPSKYSCGDKLTDYYLFPFWGDASPESCGHHGFELHCVKDNHTVIDIVGLEFRVLSVDQTSRTMTLARNDLFMNPCVLPKIQNTALNPSFFAYDHKRVANLTLLYHCSEFNDHNDDVLSSISSCPDAQGVFYANDSSLKSVPVKKCEAHVTVPVPRDVLLQIEAGTMEVIEGLNKGFEVNYMDLKGCVADCMTLNSNRSCGFDTEAQFLCSCLEGFQPSDSGACVLSHRHKRKDVKLKVGIAVGSFAFGAVIVLLVICYRWRKRIQKSSSTLLSRSSDISSSMNDVEKGGSIHGSIRVFTYEELVEATNNFDSSKELGDGGFGTVYHGKLRDGRSVAVKRLYENNYRRVEQFVNEAKILASVRHENLVSLYGCTSRHCRELLLVYEYVPNGTVADHLHGPRARPGGLAWPARLSIAIDTAAALTYLHRSEIVHRDVKTTNILLDSHFRVKVADFGLSRLFPTEATHVSTAPQGTPGYVDPDYHLCYQLTSKSDVFSFGVVLVELISSMPAVDITRHRHDINLSTMALNRIQNHALHELVDSSLGFTEDPQVQRSITAVAELAFRCLQQEKDMRPSMDDVWEELNANHEREYVAATETASVPVPTTAVASADDAAVLLKNGPLTLSPDSLTLSWGSGRSTTPKSSS